jgi:hypothetical protein
MPEARISPKVIFIGRVRAVIPHNSPDRALREAATAWACSQRRHTRRALTAVNASLLRGDQALREGAQGLPHHRRICAIPMAGGHPGAGKRASAIEKCGRARRDRLDNTKPPGQLGGFFFALSSGHATVKTCRSRPPRKTA